MDLKLSQTVQIGQHEVFIGEVVNTYIDELCQTEGKPDLVKTDPLLFDSMTIDYWSIGKRTEKP